MYLLKRFAGPGWSRLNAILEAQVGQLQDHIILIASACMPYPEVLAVMQHPVEVVGTEGLPGARYFPGAQALDDLEEFSQAATRSLFGIDTEYEVSTQPHSGTQANQIVANTVLEPGDTVLSLDPTLGGHISHRVLVGRRNRVTHYGLTEEGFVDYKGLEQLAREHKPRLIIAGASSYPRPFDYERLAGIARSAGAFLHADISHTALFVMSGHHPSPFPYADFATFNMTKNLRGPNGGILVYRSDLRRKIGGAIFPGTQGGPGLAPMFGKCAALQRLCDEDVCGYAEQILSAARTLGRELTVRGQTLLTQGTDCHYVVLDLRPFEVSGRKVERRLEHHRVLANRNLVPGDPRGPRVASGLRVGLTCVAQLGYSEEDLQRLAAVLDAVVRGSDDWVPETVSELLGRYHENLVSDASAETR